MSLTSGELRERGIEGKKITTKEILEIYADPGNWMRDYDGPDGSCRYVWRGPVICAWEVATWGLEQLKKDES